MDLLEIAPATAIEVVKLGDQRLRVHGVNLNQMAEIISRFPDLKSAATGEGDVMSLLISGCGSAIGPIIAAGCGHPGEKEYEQHAGRLAPDQQIKLLRAILALTFPNGVGSFVRELTSLLAGAGDEGAPKTFRIRSKPLRSNSSGSAEHSESHPTMQ